jgi:cytochrome c biogenesis protein CcmG/thiol:disulfide interchange protein DsbE
MNRYAAPIVIFGLMVVVFWLGLGKDPSVVPSPLIGKPAPEFTLPSLTDGTQQVSAAELRGQVWLLNVWATWCVGCRQEHDALLTIAASGEVPIYGLNWKDDSTQARAWLEQLGDPYVATAVDLDGRVAIDWGVYGAPETFLIGPDGTVLHKHIAPITWDIFARDFLPRIAEAREQGS